jgi:predicted MFS family arabinose efflux permease
VIVSGTGGHRPDPDAPSGGHPPRLGRLSTALVLLMITNAFMQYSLGVLGPVLVDRFGLSRTQLGLLTSVLFVVSSSASPLAGAIIDRVGARRVLVLPFASTIAGFLVLAVAPSYAILLVAVVVAGTGMAFANPLSNKLVALHVPLRRQALVLGIKQSGVQVGAATAGLIMPLAVLLLGFSVAAFVTAGVITAWMAFCLVAIPGDEGASRRELARGRGPSGVAADDEPAPDPALRRQLLRSIGGYALLMGSGLAALYAYLPLFAVERLGMSIAQAGLLASVIGLMGMVSRVAWGVLSERVGHPAFVLMLLAGTAVLAQTLLGLSPAIGAWASWTAVVLIGGSAVAWNSVAMFAVLRELGVRAAGANSGIVQLAFFSGFALGPVVFGALSDLSGGFGAGMVAVGACFVGATAVASRWAHQASRSGSIAPT